MHFSAYILSYHCKEYLILDYCLADFNFMSFFEVKYRVVIVWCLKSEDYMYHSTWEWSNKFLSWFHIYIWIKLYVWVKIIIGFIKILHVLPWKFNEDTKFTPRETWKTLNHNIDAIMWLEVKKTMNRLM